MALVISPCRSQCAWSRARASYDGQDLFDCAGCGSQWRPGEAWTPVQADGTVPPDVLAARATSGRTAGGAGSSGS